MYSGMGDTTSLVPGFPIRTSSDHSSVDSSPRHNAASHVLHRLPVPRHPPCALTHLQHKKPIRKEIAHQTHTTNHHPTKGGSPLRARCSQPLSTNQTPHPTTKDGATTRLPPHTGAREKRACCLRTQQCVWQFLAGASPPPARLLCTKPPPTTGRDSSRLS